MTPWFILSYPRSRTAWLSAFLSGAGIPCFHEAWKRVQTAQELRVLMESRGAEVVANSDCSNIFFLDQIRAEFPEARYLVIQNDVPAVLESLKSSYGDADYSLLMSVYEVLFAKFYRLNIPHLSIHCNEWSIEKSAELYESMANTPVDHIWLEQITGLMVQLTGEQIERDRGLGHDGKLTHMAHAMEAAIWA